jgi:hypothetical protein
MSDYTITEDFSVKDGLSEDDPEKLILGADLDVEFDAIQIAVATKYDSSDIATQVQAEAGTSNAVLMTPLRTAQYITDAGGGGAGVLVDIIALTDPGADRVLFWDDSANDTTWLTMGTGLTITGTTLNAVAGGVDHDALLNFVANEHIDHTSVDIGTAAAGGLSGGGDISSTRALVLDFSLLTEETTIDAANDVIAFYDNSASAMRKVDIDAILGTTLGDGKFYRNSTQSIGTSASTVVFNTDDYDSLTRGAFSNITGEYTVGADSTRIWISASLELTAHAEGEDCNLTIEVDGTEKAKAILTNRGQYGSSTGHVKVSTNLSLTTGQVVRIRAVNSNNARNSAAGTSKTYVSIIELA